MVRSDGDEPPASGFQSYPVTVASRLLSPQSEEGKTHRLMVKQLSTVRNTQRNSELYRKKEREMGDRGDKEGNGRVNREE